MGNALYLQVALLAQNEGIPKELWFVLLGILLICVVAVLWMFGVYGKLWFQAFDRPPHFIGGAQSLGPQDTVQGIHASLPVH